jgi:heme-degrading monooxygenase HmoA
MFARYVRYSLRMGARSTFEAVAKEIEPLYRELNGFHDAILLMEGTLAEYVILSLWETREDAEAAGAVRPDSQQWLNRTLMGPPVVRIYEVYAPHE